MLGVVQHQRDVRALRPHRRRHERPRRDGDNRRRDKEQGNRRPANRRPMHEPSVRPGVISYCPCVLARANIVVAYANTARTERQAPTPGFDPRTAPAYSSRISVWPWSTVWPALTSTSLTVASAGAVSSFCIFIADRM